MDDTSGFYKLDGMLLYGHTAVFNSQYELHRNQHDTYQYPADGWRWFDSRADALAFFGLPPDQAALVFSTEPAGADPQVLTAIGGMEGPDAMAAMGLAQAAEAIE